MPRRTPQDVAAKWARGMQGAIDTIKKGVESTTKNPMELAIAQKQAWVDGVQRAAASGKWERGLRRKSLPDWKRAMIEKGLQRIGSGATAAQPDVEKFQARWLAHMDALQSKLSGMPRGSFEQNVQRMLETVRHNKDFIYAP